MTRQEAYVVTYISYYGIGLGIDWLNHIDHDQSITCGYAELLIKTTNKMMRCRYRCYVLIKEYQRRYGDELSCDCFFEFLKNQKNNQDQLELMLAAIDVLQTDMNVVFKT